MRGATASGRVREENRYVSIHAPRAGRDSGDPERRKHMLVSIHAPRAGRDHCIRMCANMTAVSIHAPRAGRDSRPCCRPKHVQVSIHAPRAGRDDLTLFRSSTPRSFNPRAPCGARPRQRQAGRPQSRFNPRAPCGARLVTAIFTPSRGVFQSTRPVRGATFSYARKGGMSIVSIHAPRAGRDVYRNGHIERISSFNPRAPCGARRVPLGR